MREYNDLQWVENFWMCKDGVRQLTNIITSHMSQKDINYRKAIPILVRVALAFYKLTQGMPLLHVSETFAIEKNTVLCIIKGFIFALNVELRRKINWPRGA